MESVWIVRMRIRMRIRMRARKGMRVDVFVVFVIERSVETAIVVDGPLQGAIS